MHDLISIITPLYNSKQYILESIQSVQSQTYANWEMIIIDDASTDGSYEIIKSFATKDERIRFIKLDVQQGPAVARNKGIKESYGGLEKYYIQDNTLHIGFDKFFSGKLCIMDLMGRIIYEKGVSNVDRHEIQLSPILSSGVYVLFVEGRELRTALQFFFDEK